MKKKETSVNLKLQDNHTQSKSKIPFAVSEAYKSIRTNLVTMLKNDDNKVIAISSPSASEGKSTTSVNIAISFSQLNKKVLLVDADAHRPSIHIKCKYSNDKGFLSILTGNSTFEESVNHFNPYLDVLTSGPLVSNPTELLSTSNFDEFLEEMKERYEYVIFDSPPVNLLSDAPIVAQKCTGIIMIVRAGITTHEALKHAISNLKNLEINILGLVLNGSSYGSKKYYSKYYKKYYDKYYNKYGNYGNYGKN